MSYAQETGVKQTGLSSAGVLLHQFQPLFSSRDAVFKIVAYAWLPGHMTKLRILLKPYPPPTLGLTGTRPPEHPFYSGLSSARFGSASWAMMSMLWQRIFSWARAGDLILA